MLGLTQFVFTTACACHDVSKANEWAMFFEYGDKDLLRDVFVGFESLRNSVTLIGDYLDQWIALRIQAALPLSPPEIDEYRMTWVCIGVDSDIIDAICEQLQLRFVDGRLLVCETSFAAEEDLFSRIRGIMLTAFSFRRFSETRWASVGSSAQGVVAGLMLGLSDLVQYILNDPASSKYFLRGWSRLSGDRLEFVVVQSLVTRVSDGLLLELMKDSRVLLREDELQDVIQDELSWLSSLPLSVYSCFGGLVELSGQALRHRCIRAGLVIKAFVQFRIFDCTKQLPYCMARGDRAELRQNLDMLRAGRRHHGAAGGTQGRHS
ncbi:unnamed protein product [Prorocentrum cordatum]|uniref:Uncharacterized protein n=1 Tax=Prorocentrum cordatum TaxID=2364126 RepID=A0ABN9SVI7_9DINO|nr:unnamed protein product [Polarella glacialis]